ncbi:DnaD domain protein [Companilactobacillus mishanensis]|uniref:DnaD domain protein n=1 Tax=Companilactobacillus mishanensis TaxID=2486008 RepID=UPI0012949D70|nr:hypothetical protein [Companilactobacillus mishanensis]
MPFESNQENLTPLTGFWCVTNNQFDDNSRRLLTDLYLPLIGTTAFSIYQLLWEKVPVKQIVTQRQSHSVLFSLLDIDTNQFVNERIKLEALGLLKTFQKEDEMGSYLVYQLFSPLSAKEFFNDDLLSVFLLEKIGESEYAKLADKYRTKIDIIDDAEDISKGFLDVFRLSDDDLINTPAEVSNSRENFKNTELVNTPKVDEKSSTKLDFELISERVSQLYKISREDLIKNEDTLNNLHSFYGIDEIELIDIIGKTEDLVKNQIDSDALKRLAQKRFENRVNISARVPKEKIQESAPSKSGSNNPQSTLIERANSMTPADFLAAEKQSKGGFTGTAESNALRQIANQSFLPVPVLNIMIHYILESSSALTRPFMETVANDWKMNGVKTPEDALKRISDFQNKPRNPRGRYNNSSNRVEQATDWSKIENKSVTNADAKKVEQDRMEQLRKLRDQGK